MLFVKCGEEKRYGWSLGNALLIFTLKFIHTYTSLQKIMSKINEDIPLLCVCGNHDVGNTPNKVTLERYKNDFGDDYFSFSVRGVRGIVINSNLYYDPSEVCVCVCVAVWLVI